MVHQVTNPAATEASSRMTYQESLDWATDRPHAEWVDGEVIEFTPVTVRRLLLLSYLVRLFGTYLGIRRRGPIVGSPYGMLIRGGRSCRQPDIAVLLTANRPRFTEAHLEGPADLVVEFVSEESVRRDRHDELAEYAAAGVREYWMVEGRTRRHGVELHVRSATGACERALPDTGGRLRSTGLPGFWLNPTWLAKEPLPDLAEIGPGIHEERAERARRRRAARDDHGS